MRVIIAVCLLFNFVFFAGANAKLPELTSRQQALYDRVKTLNSELNYDESILVLSDFINDPKSSDYDKYLGYLYKAHTYKSVFNYIKTDYNLDLALEYGLKTAYAKIIKSTIMAEKSFVYFDTQNYEKASELIRELRVSNFEFLEDKVKAWVIMQEGYISMLNRAFNKAEDLLDSAESLIISSAPNSVANIHGKKIELYHRSGQYEKRDALIAHALELTRSQGHIKYELYLLEIIKNIYQEVKDFEKAMLYQVQYDSLSLQYNALDRNVEILEAEKYLEDKAHELEKSESRNEKSVLIGVILSLLGLSFASLALYRSNKIKRLKVEKENALIRSTVESLSEQIENQPNIKTDISQFGFSERQLEVIQLVQEGKSNKEIAEILFISENTVKYHLRVIYENLKINKRIDLTKLGL